MVDLVPGNNKSNNNTNNIDTQFSDKQLYSLSTFTKDGDNEYDCIEPEIENVNENIPDTEIVLPIINPYYDISDNNISDSPIQIQQNYQSSLPPESRSNRLFSQNSNILYSELTENTPEYACTNIPLINWSDAKPMVNILENHPLLNRHLSLQESIATAAIDIPVHKIPIEIVQPFKENVISVADTGANIEVIGPNIAIKYKAFLKQDRKETKLRTANGDTSIRQYLPVYAKNGNKLIKCKFYVLWDLPYDYLIGRSLIHALGWQLQLRPGSYYHKAETLDDVDEDLPELHQIDHLIEKGGKNGEIDNDEVGISKLDCDSDSIKRWLKSALQKYENTLAKYEVDSGEIPGVEFRVDFKDNIDTTPQVYSEYPHPTMHITEIERQLKLLVEKGFISRSISEWRFPTFIVPKKTGDARIVFDFRGLNKITRSMQHPLPNPVHLMHKFKDKKIFSCIDIKGGYWHIPVHKEHRKRLAFVFNNKLYEWNVMPFGPKNAPAYFQKTMNEIFSDMDFVIVYMDDVTIISDNEEEHKIHLEKVLNRIKEKNIKLRIDKCKFGKSECEFLGFIANKYGVKPTDKYKNKIINVPRPKDKSEMQRFLGLINYLHRFIPNLHITTGELSQMIHKNVKYKWNDIRQRHFDEAKEKVQKADILFHPDMNKEFYVVADASSVGIGGMIAQLDENGVLRPVEFCSKLFNQTQQNWHVSEQEIYAVIYLVEKWRYLLAGKKFTVLTDHLNLQELFNKCKNFRAGKLYRWAVRLQDYEFEAKYIPGKDNIFADYLSRNGLPIENVPVYTTNNNKDILNLYTNCLIQQSISEYPYQRLYEASTAEYDKFTYRIKPETNIIFRPSDVIAVGKINSKTECFPFNRTPDSNSPDDDDFELSPRSRKIFEKDTNNKPQPTLELPDLFRHAPPLPSVAKPIQPQRRSKRIQNRNPHTDAIDDEPLKIADFIPENDISIEQRNQISENIRKVRVENEDRLENKPDYLTYNPRIFAPSSIPIFDHNSNSVPNITTEIIRDKQIDDPLCYAILEFLNNNNTNLLWDLPKYLLNYVKSGRYCIKDNLLKFRSNQKDTNDNIKYLTVVPGSLIPSILQLAHSYMHIGSGKMRQIIERDYWWPKYYVDCVKYCTHCDACQKGKKGSGRNIKYTPKIKLFPASQPNEMVSIDIVGPLPITKSRYRYMVTMIDKFTRYAMIVPVKNIKAMTVLKAFGKWITLFGAPKTLLSDNGTQFISAIMQSYTQKHGTEQRFTTTYHPECNGQIERLHRWIKERLTLICCDTGKDFINNKEDDWAEYLDIIQYTYNATPNKMTNFTPSELMIGRKLKLPLDTEDPINPFDMRNTPKEYVEYMYKRYKVIHNKARMKQAKYDKLRKIQYDKNKDDATYKVGEYVLEDITPRLVGNERKLVPNYVGPYEITQVFHNGANYRIVDCQHGVNSHVVSAKHLKRYRKLNEEDIPTEKMMNYITKRMYELCKTKRKTDDKTWIEEIFYSQSEIDRRDREMKMENQRLNGLFTYFMGISL